MNFIKLIFVLSYLSFCSCHYEDERFKNAPRLKMLFSYWRHGSRSPAIALIPNDPNNKEWDKTCIGELTNVGKKEQLLNGRLTLKRYEKLLGGRYNCSTLYVQSTTIPRAVMSGSSFMAGVYPPRFDQVWTNETIGQVWQPVPIYTTDIAGSSLLAISIPNGFNSTGIYDRHKNAIDAIVGATGASLDNFFQVISYVDALVCEAYLGYPLPFDLHLSINELMEISGESLAYFVKDIYVKMAAALLNDTVKRIDAFKSGQSLTHTNFYSMHDAHVYAVMLVLTGQNVGQPPFSSTIYLELWEEGNSEYVQLFYRPTVRSDPTVYAIKNCSLKCPLDKFRSLVNSLNN